MEYVHRACLDEWRVNSFNPRALVTCTTCRTPFKVRVGDREPQGHRWWVRFGKDVTRFFAFNMVIFLVSVVALGFWPRLLLGAGAGLHPNPVFSHLLCGAGTAFAIAGTFAILQLPGVWHTGEGFRLILDVWCPRRGSKSSGLETLVAILIIIGLLVCIFFILRGIWRLFNEGRHELLRAARGANQQVRRQIVKDYVVLDYEAAEAAHENESRAGASCSVRGDEGPGGGAGVADSERAAVETAATAHH